ncbi:CtrA inhibitor SciP [Frigidibacter sp. MR17.24]|uniref:CtrA inhibitor SciP n=1 Tax=Frigidibacter sp. MR17.24 TaxID=3127345 RepID=UPI003012E1B0
MYLKKVDGPRAVTLDDGTILTRADLPPPETRRWVASRKYCVVRAVEAGLLTETEALERYALTTEEFGEWRAAVAGHGMTALKVTSLQKFRQPRIDPC